MLRKKKSTSPRWSNNTKLVVGLTLVAFIALLLISFRTILGPLLLSFVLAYLFYPLANYLCQWLKVSWRMGATLIYLFVLILMIGALTWGGISLVEQIVSMVNFLNNAITDLPEFLSQLSELSLQIGPLIFDLRNLELTSLATQLLGTIQPLFSQAGVILGTFASGAASTIGWVLFILLISYFILSETGGFSNRLLKVEIPGYQEDLQRMGTELGRIWNAFLRGQLILIVMTIVIYIIVLGSLGMRFFIGLAFLAGLACFIPYVGPAITWVTYGLVAFFQVYTVFGLSPIAYALLVVGISLIINVIMDQIITPRLMADALEVHPAAVLVAALIAARWLGVIGIVLAAPVMATIMLFLEYALRKLFDQDPWAKIKTAPPPPPLPASLSRLEIFWNNLKNRLEKRPKISNSDSKE